MPELNLNAILAALGYAALTGIFNLIFARKSQIEAWAESKPRLAALLKLTRSVGFDPWNAISALSLFFAKKLPEIQKSDSTIAKLEQRKADEKRLGGDGPVSKRSVPPIVMLALCLAVLLLPSCAGLKAVVRSSNDIARDLCVLHFGAKSKLSAEDVAREFCETRDDLAPWLDAVLAAKREAAPIAEARKP
jgi:hypothetical protein